MRTNSISHAFAVAALALSAPASAADAFFDFEVTSLGTFGDGAEAPEFTVSGQFLATETMVDSVYRIVEISGIRTGLGAGSISLSALGGLGGNDNLLFLNGGSLLSNSGFSYFASGIEYNVFTSAQLSGPCSGYVEFSSQSSSRCSAVTNVAFSVASVEAAVPEPATWLLMLLGFGFVGGMMRQRKQQVCVTYA